MRAFTFALGAAASWGVADFAGGTLSRDRPSTDVVLAVQSTAIVVLIALVGAGVLPRPDVLILPAALAGVSSGCAVLLLYRALGIGPMGVVAPIFAMSALVPVLVGLASGDHVGSLQALGMAGAIGGCVLATRGSAGAGRPDARAIALASGAALFIGMGLVGLHSGARTSSTLALEESRVTEFLTVVAIALATRAENFAARLRPSRGLVAIGLGDLAASYLFAEASVHGALAIVSVLASIFPALTAVLAWVFLHERMRLGQRLGVGLAFGGVALLIAG